MKTRMNKIRKRCLALMMVCALCLPLGAQAVTADQMKVLLKENYLREVPEEALAAETVEEVMAAVNDPYTVYMNEEEFIEFMDSMSDDEVVGIGVSAIAVDNGLYLLTVYADSPAQKLGLSAGDVITSVDGKSAAGETAEEVSTWLKGTEGTTVSFSVLHADGTQEDYTAQRAHVDIPTALTEEREDGRIGYIVCNSIGEETVGHFTEGVLACDDADLWVVDLRENGGGDIYAVTQMLGIFLGDKTMFYLRDKDDTVYRSAADQEAMTIYPVIALVGENTASSAEIFATVLQEERGGMVIGTRTFGKGVAQIILDGETDPEVFTEQDAARITTFQYYNTGGTSANRVGVIPDLLVPEEKADAVACLFESCEPEDSTGWVYLILGGRNWFVNMREAVQGENRAAFQIMLEALPPDVQSFIGAGSGWRSAPVSHIAAIAGIQDYSPRRFTDLAGESCQHAADTLLAFGLLSGYPDGTFRPAASLTRAELCALLTQAMQLPEPTRPAAFTDVKAGSWQEPYIQAVCGAGYMQGVSADRFDPNGYVTNEQLYTVLGRLAADLNLYFYEASKEVPAETDIPTSFSAWARPWVWLLAESQKNVLGQTLTMLEAPVTEISPRAAASRGETAEVLYNILHATDVIIY